MWCHCYLILVWKVDMKLPVLQEIGHSLKLGATGGNRLNAAPQSSILPHSGRGGAPQSHLACIQNISD